MENAPSNNEASSGTSVLSAGFGGGPLDELLKIHTILQAPGDCPDISDGDTLTVRMLKAVIHDWHKQQRIVAAMSADRFGPPGRGARGLGPPPTTPQVAAMQQSQQGEIVAGKPETPNAELRGRPLADGPA